MLMWIILGVLAILGIIYFFNSYQNKYQSFQGGLFNFFVGAFLIFIIFSFAYVYLTSHITITKLGDLFLFFKAYFSWLVGAFRNTKGVVGYAIKQDWAANATNLTR